MTHTSTATAYMGTSLDGFIATEDGGLDWLMSIPNPDLSDFGYAAFMDRVDAVVMGRNTFEAVCGFPAWPYTTRVFVLSNRLTTLPDDFAGKAELIRGGPQEIIAQLAERGLYRLYIDGGAVVTSFLEADAIDELVITRLPVVLGKGIPLFGGMPRPLWFDHVRTEVLLEQMVKTTYLRRRDPAKTK
ncbi:MAG: dihydrofolate reductase [Myxococcota bacterium]|jgi:dihydrofolate reductase